MRMTLTKFLVIFGVVVLFAGIVALAATPAYVRDTQRVAELNQIQKALEFYYADNKMYPPFTAYTTSEQCGFNWCKLEAALSLYMKQLPRDPKGLGSEYAYYYDASAGNEYQSYGLMTRMERSSDDQRVNTSGYYEIGTRPLYCMRKYATSTNPSDRQWWPRSEQQTAICGGGN